MLIVRRAVDRWKPGEVALGVLAADLDYIDIAARGTVRVASADACDLRCLDAASLAGFRAPGVVLPEEAACSVGPANGNGVAVALPFVDECAVVVADAGVELAGAVRTAGRDGGPDEASRTVEPAKDDAGSVVGAAGRVLCFTGW